ncbi:MAG: metallopeptidase family protein [Actinomycetota bacterium]|nr:metallopeptidase family protein [Actinomycetota bacterium]MDP8954817.1 metallopeptidase family protein [Actinomycetota bacterium]
MIDVPTERFEALVADALDEIPEELGRLMDNVVVQVREASPSGLLGLYQGVPLTEREAYGGLAMPDRITVYRRSICQRCRTEAEVVEEVRVTVVHEVAHHFGIDDHRLDELGWA